MSKPKPLGIRAAIWLAIALTVASTLLGAASLYGYQLYRHTEAAEALRVRTLASAYAAQATEWLMKSRSELSERIGGLRWHTDVRLLAVVAGDLRANEADGLGALTPPSIIALRGDNRLVDRFLKDNEALASGLQRVPLPAASESDRTQTQLYLATAPIVLPGSDKPAATVLCGARCAARHMLASREIGIFFSRLLLAAGAGALMGFWWLRRSVVEPLALLLRHLSRSLDQDEHASLHADRDDEIGRLARAVGDMHGSLTEWRERATRLERSVHQRVASETQRVNRELRQATRKIWIDPLTRLGNRRLLDDQFAPIFNRQRSAGDDLSVVMIDVDHFKKLNDCGGHQTGDGILRFIGELIRQSLRDQDLAVRYGGDEFLLILPSVSLRDAVRIAERTILLFNQQARLLKIEPRASLSAGVASLREHHAAAPEDLIELADAALYEAKRAGKARVNTAQPRCRETLVGAK